MDTSLDNIPSDFEDEAPTQTTTKILKRVKKTNKTTKSKTQKVEVSGGALTSAAEAKIKARQENRAISPKSDKWGHDLFEQVENEKDENVQISGPIPGFKNNYPNAGSNQFQNGQFQNHNFTGSVNFYQRGGTRGGHRFGYGNQSHHGGTIIRREEDLENEDVDVTDDDADDGMRWLN